MTRSYEPAPSIEKDVTKAQVTIDADDNDTSFEIDEPEEEEIVDEDHTVTITESISKLNLRHSTPTELNTVTSKSDQVPKDDSAPSTSGGIVGLPRVGKGGNVRQESNDDSDCSYDSYTYSSTPTTADVADVAAVSVYPNSNACCSNASKQSSKRLIPPSHVLVIAVQTSHIHDTASVVDDNGSSSLATTTTDLDIDNTPSTSSNVKHLSRIENSPNVMYNSAIHSMPSVLLAHPSAAFQDAESSAIDIPATQTKRHQRTLSSTSHRSIASQHSVRTANTTLSITLPKSRIWTGLRWMCLRFKVNIFFVSIFLMCFPLALTIFETFETFDF